MNMNVVPKKNRICSLGLILFVIFSIAIFTKSSGQTTDSSRDKEKESVQTPEKFIESVIDSMSTDSVLAHLQRYLINRDSLKISKENWRTSKIRAITALSKFWYEKGNMDSALHYAKKSAESNFLEGDEKLKLNSLIALSKAYFSSLETETSTKYAFEALNHAKKYDLKNGLIDALNMLANNFWLSSDLKAAENYYSEALKVISDDNLKQPLKKAALLGNLAIVYKNQGDNAKSRNFHERSLTELRAIGNPYHLSLGLQNYATLLEHTNEYDAAISILNEALQINTDQANYQGLTHTYFNLAINYSSKKNFNYAKKFLDSALNTSSRANVSFGKDDIYKLYADILAEENQYMDAYRFRIKYENWKDSVSLESQKLQVKELEKKYKAEEKENEILRLTQENLIKERDLLKKSKTLRIFLIVTIIALLLFSAGFFVFKFRSSLANQREIFKTMVQTEIKEQHRIARDLHDSIGSMLATLKGQLSMIKPDKPQNKEAWNKSLDILDKTIAETRRISHNMMPQELVKFGLVSAIQTLLDDIEAYQNISSKLVCNINEEDIDMSLKLHLYRIIQELLQNVIKHSKSDILNIRISESNDVISVVVVDKGTGFRKTPEKNGYGLKNIQSRLDFLKGKWSIKSESKKGTTVSLKIPLYD